MEELRSPHLLSGFVLVVAMGCLLAGGVAGHEALASHRADAGQGGQREDPVSSLSFEHVGFFGGAVSGVAVDGRTAYISRGVHVEAYDVGNPLSPVLLGRSAPLPGLARVALATGSRVYLVETVRHADKTGIDRLHIVDGADPTLPELSASLDLPKGSLSSLAVADGWLYGAAGETGLVVVDVRDPTQPSLFATVATDKAAAAIALGGESLLVGVGARANEGGLRVFERSEPAAPRQVGAVDVGQKSSAVVSLRNYALLATWENVLVIDVADPARPRIASQLRAYGGSAFAVNGNHAFLLRSPLAVRERPQLCALDISALPDVRNLGELPLWNGYGVASAGEQVLAADGECGLSDSRARGRRRGATRRPSSRSDDR